MKTGKLTSLTLLLFAAIILQCCKKREGAAAYKNAFKHHPGRLSTPGILKDLVFADKKSQLLQEVLRSENSERTRILYLEEDNTGGLFRYSVIEKNKIGHLLNSFRVLSRHKIDSASVLFSLSPDPNKVAFYSSTALRRSKEKLTAHYSGQSFDLGTGINKAVPCEPGQQICIDWYWTTFEKNTGVTLSEMYLYNTCYTSCPGSSEKIQPGELHNRGARKMKKMFPGKKEVAFPKNSRPLQCLNLMAKKWKPNNCGMPGSILPP